jgi:hypothetical protein
MISALEHYSYCPRQCALIHVEQVYDENLYTLRGKRIHERVHSPVSKRKDDTRIERAQYGICRRISVLQDSSAQRAIRSRFAEGSTIAPLRPAYGSGEDWNQISSAATWASMLLRPAYGSGEDWNYQDAITQCMAFRCARPTGRARIETTSGIRAVSTSRSYARPTGRARIGTQVFTGAGQNGSL